MKDLLSRYEQWMRAAGWSSQTIKQRLRRGHSILDRWPDLASVMTEDVVGYLSESADLKPWTRTTYYNDTRAFFRWLHDSEVIDRDPMDSRLVRRPRARQGVPKPLSDAEEARVLELARGRERAYILLALRAGLRASEIGAFRGECIEPDFVIVTGKGEKEAAVPTHPELWELAQDYPRRGYWFPMETDPDRHVAGQSVGSAVGYLFRVAGIQNGSIHRCRHSFGTSLLRNGANLREVQSLMRHSTLATTAIYTAVDELELRAAVHQLGGSTTARPALRLVR